MILKMTTTDEGELDALHLCCPRTKLAEELQRVGDFIPDFLVDTLTGAARRTGECMTAGNSCDAKIHRRYQWVMIVRWDDSAHIVAVRALLDERLEEDFTSTLKKVH